MHIGECQKGRVGGTDGMVVQESDSDAMSCRLLVVARSVWSQEMSGTT